VATLVAGGVVRGIRCLVVLAEELLTFWFGEVSQDHQRIGGVFRRLCGHAAQLRPPAVLSLLAAPTQDAGAAGAGSGHLPEQFALMSADGTAAPTAVRPLGWAEWAFPPAQTLPGPHYVV
jgi:hypothetical protein